MAKVWKALVTLAVLVLLFVPAARRSLPAAPGTALLFGVVTYGISLFFHEDLPLRRRLGMAYLVLTGIDYLIAGVLGLLPNWGLIEASAWSGLVSPFPLWSLLKAAIYLRPFRFENVSYTIFPVKYEHPGGWFDVAVVVVSLVAVAAAIAMAKNRRAAYHVWFGLLVFTLLDSLGYVVAELSKWGMPHYEGPIRPIGTIMVLCLATSYVLAYILARRRVELQ